MIKINEPKRRIVLSHIGERFIDLEEGDKGTVLQSEVNSDGDTELLVLWDCGSILTLVSGRDMWEEI
jgi:hypothetical protein